jgi:two-component system cell cycle response regulator
MRMGGHRIFVVDDNPVNLKLITRVLETDGYQVTHAENAEIALEQIRQSPPDLILMDIELPGMDGLTLTRILKADPATTGIPIVALTAYAMKGDAQRARDSGCDGYLTKPINTRTLAEQIRWFLHEPLRTISGSPLRILVVEDQPSDLKLACVVLTCAGYEVAEARSAEEAINAVETSPPGLILLDLKLPGISGLTLIRRLRAAVHTRHTPIVAVTSYPDQQTEKEAREAGCNGYFVKPLDVDQMLREIAGIVAKRRQER